MDPFSELQSELQSLESRINSIKQEKNRAGEQDVELVRESSQLGQRMGFRERWLGGKCGGDPTLKARLKSIEDQQSQLHARVVKLDTIIGTHEQYRHSLISSYLLLDDPLFQCLHEYKTELQAVLQNGNKATKWCEQITNGNAWQPRVGPVVVPEEELRDSLLHLSTAVRTYNTLLLAKPLPIPSKYWPSTSALEPIPPLSYHLGTFDAGIHERHVVQHATHDILSELISFSFAVNDGLKRVNSYVEVLHQEVYRRCVRT